MSVESSPGAMVRSFADELSASGTLQA